jgi:hypothetical protein
MISGPLNEKMRCKIKHDSSAVLLHFGCGVWGFAYKEDPVKRRIRPLRVPGFPERIESFGITFFERPGGWKPETKKGKFRKNPLRFSQWVDVKKPARRIR